MLVWIGGFAPFFPMEKWLTLHDRTDKEGLSKVNLTIEVTVTNLSGEQITSLAE